MLDGRRYREPNGFAQGNVFIFRYWKQSTGEEIESVVYTFPYPNYDEQFTSLGTAIVSLSATVTETQSIILSQGWFGDIIVPCAFKSSNGTNYGSHSG